MLRKGAVHIEALKSLAGDGTAESDAADEAAELTESLSELQGTSAVDLLPALAGDGSNEGAHAFVEPAACGLGPTSVVAGLAARSRLCRLPDARWLAG